MATDSSYDDLAEDDERIWAPLHARRALGQMRAPEAIEPLLGLLPRLEENDDEWVSEELP